MVPHLVPHPKNVKGWGDVAALGHGGELRGIGRLERLHVTLQKECVIVVERLHVGLNPIPSLFFRERFSGKVVIL